MKSYWKPTPVKWRMLGDALLAVSTFITGQQIIADNKVFAVIILCLGVIGSSSLISFRKAMKLKNNVRLTDLKPQLILAMIITDQIYAKHGQELVLTSVDDSVHGPGSLHPSGNAFDARTSYFTAEERKLVFQELKEALDVNYDLVDEGDHFHIEYDPH
jgi:hypothetical protein